jgi:hypothetical protein
VSKTAKNNFFGIIIATKESFTCMDGYLSGLFFWKVLESDIFSANAWKCNRVNGL